MATDWCRIFDQYEPRLSGLLKPFIPQRSYKGSREEGRKRAAKAIDIKHRIADYTYVHSPPGLQIPAWSTLHANDQAWYNPCNRAIIFGLQYRISRLRRSHRQDSAGIVVTNVQREVPQPRAGGGRWWLRNWRSDVVPSTWSRSRMGPVDAAEQWSPAFRLLETAAVGSWGISIL
jgi:hypothetical protein